MFQVPRWLLCFLVMLFACGILTIGIQQAELIKARNAPPRVEERIVYRCSCSCAPVCNCCRCADRDDADPLELSDDCKARLLR